MHTFVHNGDITNAVLAESHLTKSVKISKNAIFSEGVCYETKTQTLVFAKGVFEYVKAYAVGGMPPKARCGFCAQTKSILQVGALEKTLLGLQWTEKCV